MGGYHPNPPRKCGGSKQPDSFYLEGGDFDPNGSLHNWAWLLGDGVGRHISFTKEELPPRQVVGVNPLMTILFESYVPADGPAIPVPDDKRLLYERLAGATKQRGIADHVGDSHYSAWDFYLETAEYGPSRRVSKDVAKSLGDLIHEFGPLPMMFAHSQIPVFRNDFEFGVAMGQVNAVQDPVEWSDRYRRPTWDHESWGTYARYDQWIGSSHVLIPMLAVIDDLKNHWQEHKEEKVWQDARAFFKTLRYAKQTFGMSWLCRVSYTLPKDGAPDQDAYEIPGINVIDLEEVGEFDGEVAEAT
jgi:hypothetical protein